MIRCCMSFWSWMNWSYRLEQRVLMGRRRVMTGEWLGVHVGRGNVANGGRSGYPEGVPISSYKYRYDVPMAGSAG